MKLFKLAIYVIVIVLIGYLIYDNFYFIINRIELVYTNVFSQNNKQTLVDNAYRKKTDYAFVKINNDTNIKSKEMLKDIIYTYLDAGWNDYVMICDPSYYSCIDDVKQMAQNNSYLTDLSNFVHPFNTFEKINTTFTSSGKITLSRKPRYTNEQIEKINEKVDYIYKTTYDSNKSVKDNIKTFHDYIINNTKYDTNNSNNDITSSSSNAYGVLFDGIGICSGYTDAMALFLEKMGVKNYRISSSNHVWNLAYVNNEWLHIDLTWDDPVMSDGTDAISDKYLLITTEELKQRGDNEHNFNSQIYIEAQ